MIAEHLLAETLRAGKPGINLLFYGATGSGKTELARLLAKSCKASLHVAGKEDESGEYLEPDDRLRSLLLGNKMLASGSSILLFDEMEDLFDSSRVRNDHFDRSAPSKQWFNLLLETNPVPTIWIANSVSGMDTAFRRRFSYAIEFKPLGVAQRRRVWQRHLGSGSRLDDTDLESLAERFTISAGQIATGISAARLVTRGEPDRATIEKIVAPLERLVGGNDQKRRHATSSQPYFFEAVNASCDLRALSDRLASCGVGAGAGMSLCLYGPPGTGKSEFVHHLAKRMDRRVLVRRVSDILSKWVGEAERNIADAFAEAESDGAVLLFDEADSFLRDRRDARHSWEVTQVNEFLQQLEAFRGFVACTTNLYKDLDQASLRRFVFKIEFMFLNREQVVFLFRSVLLSLLVAAPSLKEQEEIEYELGKINNLTPGDFATVTRRMRAIGDATISAFDLVAELQAESEAKEGRGKR